MYDNKSILLKKSYVNEPINIFFDVNNYSEIDDKHRNLKMVSYYYKSDKFIYKCENILLLCDNDNNFYVCKIINMFYKIYKNSNEFRTI